MADILLDPLQLEDAKALFEFEAENREWFEKWVGPRPDTYWQLDTLRRLIWAQITEDDLMYVIRAPATGAIQGRLNLTAFTDGVAQIGYRVGQDFTGRGVATKAVAQALPIARAAGLWALEARVANTNPTSRRVLERNGFTPVPNQVPASFRNADGAQVDLTILRCLLD